MSLRLLLIFFISGISGLVYQVIWTRLFGNMFGNTVFSASLVTAVFMLGLGIGSWLVGGLCDRSYRSDARKLLHYYAYAEMGIALLALGLALLFPNMNAFAALFSNYRVDVDGWYVLDGASIAARYALALILLLPITALMGATLTFLVRFVVSDSLQGSGARIGLLYGINTAGAAVGAGVVDFGLIPAFGMFGAQSVAVVLNLLAGLGALLLSRSLPASPPGVTSRHPTVTSPWRLPSQKVMWVAAAIFFSGCVGMAVEIVWYRFFISTLGATRGIFSLLLFVMLLGLWLGASSAGWLQRFMGRSTQLYMLSQLLFVGIALYQLVQFQRPVMSIGEVSAILGSGSFLAVRLAEIAYMLKIIAPTVFIPAFFMGFAYPLANAIAQDELSEVGTRAGIIYLANMCGSVLGSLGAGFVLLPLLGMKNSIAVLLPVTALSILCLGMAARRQSGAVEAGLLSSGLGVASVVLAAVLWSKYPADYLVLKTFLPYDVEKERIIATSEGVNESIVVTEHVDSGSRSLYTNGHNMSDNGFRGQRYMRAFAHLPLLQIEKPTTALVICFGVGNTASAAALHPSLERLDVVDTSRHVLEHADYFAATNFEVLRDPRIRVHVNDGRLHLRMVEDSTYDLITLEPPPIAFAGVGGLYSREFYQLARRKLNSGGFVTQWLPTSQVSGESVKSMVRAFIEVFPDALLLSGSYDHLILIGRKDGHPEFDPQLFIRRAGKSEALLADMEGVSLGSPREIAGSFVASYPTMARAVADALPVTDDLPVMEYDVLFFNESSKPAALFDVSDAGVWCPACFDGRAIELVDADQLRAYLALTQSLYNSEKFLYSGRMPVEEGQIIIPLDPARYQALLRDSRYLRVILGIEEP